MFQSWVLSVLAVAVLSIFCDILLPDGQSKKYIRFVMGIVVSLILITPLTAKINDFDNTYSRFLPTFSDFDGSYDDYKYSALTYELNANGFDVNVIVTESCLYVSCPSATCNNVNDITQICLKYYDNYDVVINDGI